MIEVFVERWSRDGHARHPWSVWMDGKQLASSHGRREYDSPEEAEADARRFCAEILNRAPDRIDRL